MQAQGPEFESPSLERFTQGARSVLAFAIDEATRLNHSYIGTEHLLLGMTRLKEDDPAIRLLVSLGVNVDKTRSAVEFIVGRTERNRTDKAPKPAPYTKHIILTALEEAQREEATEISTLHLLIGLSRQADSIASGLLESMGVDTAKIYDEMQKQKKEQS